MEWGDLTWAVEDYRKLKARQQPERPRQTKKLDAQEAVAAMFESEISEVCGMASQTTQVETFSRRKGQ